MRKLALQLLILYLKLFYYFLTLIYMRLQCNMQILHLLL